MRLNCTHAIHKRDETILPTIKLKIDWGSFMAWIFSQKNFLIESSRKNLKGLKFEFYYPIFVGIFYHKRKSPVKSWVISKQFKSRVIKKFLNWKYRVTNETRLWQLSSNNNKALGLSQKLLGLRFLYKLKDFKQKSWICDEIWDKNLLMDASIAPVEKFFL